MVDPRRAALIVCAARNPAAGSKSPAISETRRFEALLDERQFFGFDLNGHADGLVSCT